MARVRGRAEVSRYLRDLPADLTKVLRGAGRAGGDVIAEEAKLRSRSDYVSERIITNSRIEADHIRVTVTVEAGFARSVAIWMEYGTSPHFITVDDQVRQGQTARRINRAGDAAFKATLVINGKPVGSTVYHPGARPYPFLRPAIDSKGTDAVSAAQAHINSRISAGAVLPDSNAEEKDL
jgi:hypothetical protein